MTSTAVAFLAAFLSAVCNGSFAAMSKVVPAQHPFVFNAWLGVGVLLSSLLHAGLIMPYADAEPLFDFQFDVRSALSGCLLGLATLFSFLAIPRVGLATGQGVWGGTAVTVSFLWGVLGPSPIGSAPKSAAWSAVGVGLIVVGILGIVLLDGIARRLGLAEPPQAEEGPNGEYRKLDDAEAGLLAAAAGASPNIGATVLPGSPSGGSAGASDAAARGSSWTSGMVFALLVGLSGGSILVPAKLSALTGVAVLPSLGLGACLTTAAPPLYLWVSGSEQLRREPKAAPRSWWADAWPGVVAGAIWNAGNALQIFAMDAGVSFAIVQPILQTGLVVSGVYGIFLFGEIRGRGKIALFFAAAAVVLVGAAVLSVAGP